MKKITDTDRIDWMQKYEDIDGAISKDDAEYNEKWHVTPASKWFRTLRQAIDAAIRAEAKP